MNPALACRVFLWLVGNPVRCVNNTSGFRQILGKQEEGFSLLFIPSGEVGGAPEAVAQTDIKACIRQNDVSKADRGK
ncbi:MULTISPECIES: hypothetical protein [unclassified Mameliella]|uniref:hypothetical protein n=1 Tax=unclassified Mameliella TaxID=2630630 RepID=UPI00273E6B9E|nr:MULTISPECIES: hypothetical protein [unclassified Mameliella]